MKKAHLFLVALTILTSCKKENIETQLIPKTTEQKVDFFLKLADSIRIKSNIPGVGLAIIYNNEILYTGGLGYRNIVEKLPVTENTLFSIGSNTKPFTGVLAAKLVTEGLLDWNTPIKTYIPELTLKEPYVANHMTIADALAHKTGLGRHDDKWKNKLSTRAELLNILENLDFASSFRATYGYNNIMYSVAGIAQERVKGKTWEELIAESIFMPLDMNDSYASHTEFINAKERAIGYKGDGVTVEPPVDMTSVAPSGSISATPKDIAKWVKMIVNEGEHNNQEYLTDEEYDYMFRPHSNIGLRNGDELWYYYTGFGGFSKNGKRNIGAEGAIEGQNSRCSMRLDEGFGIFVMTNMISDYKRLLTTYAEQIFMEDNYTRDIEWENALISNTDFEKFKKIVLEENLAKAIAFYTAIPNKSFEGTMNTLGYELIASKELEKAVFVLSLNAQDNPESANAFDSLGEVYMLKGENKLAIESYLKPLELDPKNNNAKMML